MRSRARRGGGLELGDVGVVGGAEVGFGDLDRGGEGVGGDAGVGDLAGLGAGVAVGGVRLVLGLEVGVGGGGNRLGEERGVEADPVEAALLAEEVEHRQRLALGERGGGLDAAGEKVAGRLAAHQLLEGGRHEAGALEDEGVGVAVEGAVRPVKSRRFHDLGPDRGVAGGDAEPAGLGVDGGVVDQPAEHHAVDAVLPRLGHGELAAGLLGEGAELLLHGDGERLGGHRLAADAGDVLAGDAAAGADAEAREADHEGGHQRPDQHAGAPVADGSEHASRSPAGMVRRVLIAGRGIGKGRADHRVNRRGCGENLDVQLMHNACTSHARPVAPNARFGEG